MAPLQYNLVIIQLRLCAPLPDYLNISVYGDILPRIISRLRWKVRFTPRPLYASVPFRYEVLPISPSNVNKLLNRDLSKQNSFFKASRQAHGPCILLLQGRRTYGKRKDLLGKPHSLLSQFFFYFFHPTAVPILWRLHVYMCTCLSVYRLYMNDRCYQTTLQWNIFTQTGAVRSVGWIFVVEAPAWRWLGQYVTLDRTFYSLIVKQAVAAAPFTYTLFFLSHSWRRASWEVQYNNYTMN